MFYRDHVDITSDCIDLGTASYGYVLAMDYGVVLMDEKSQWKLMVPLKYIGDIPPKGEPGAQMFPISCMLEHVRAGTKFKIIRIERDLDNWGRPYEDFHGCSMTIELDTVEKTVCEMPLDSFEINPFKFYDKYAKPVIPLK